LKTELWKSDKRLVSLIYEEAVKSFDRLIINHGYTFEELDKIREEHDIYSAWIRIIIIYRASLGKKRTRKNNIKSELAKYYDEDQIIEVLSLSTWKGCNNDISK